MKEEEIVKTAYDKGVEYEARATDCCQSTIAAVQEAIGKENDDILRAGTAMAGGLAFTCRGTCGALNGGAMVLSQLYGRTSDKFHRDAKKEINEADYVEVAEGWDLVYELYERFLGEYESHICDVIQEQVTGRSRAYNYIRPNSRVIKELIQGGGGHEKEGCPTVAGNASKWTTEIILREGLSN